MLLSIRDLFIADTNKVLIQVDLSQSEARIVAWEAEEMNLINLFTSGGDIHKINASQIFKIPIVQVTKKERQLGKKVAHATNYDMGPDTLIESIIKELGMDYIINREEAIIFQANYHKAYPGIKRWHRRVKWEIINNGYLTNCFGRKLPFLGPRDYKIWKEAYASVPQSTSVDHINRRWDEWDRLYADKYPVLGQVHDSVFIQPDRNGSAKTTARHMVKDIKAVFESEIEIRGRRLLIPIGIEAGRCWGKLKELK